MKKLIFVLFFILYAIILSAQSFHKGALVLDMKGAIDVYNTKYTYELIQTGQDTTIENKAANRNISFGLEYGVLNKLGVGIRYNRAKYFAAADDSTKQMPNIYSNNIMLLVNYHVLNGKVFNLVGGINIGYSALNVITNNIYRDEIYGSGLYFDLHISPRVYIGRFGFQLDFGMPFVNYNKLTTNNANFNQNVLAKWKGLGYSIGMGMQFRFLSKKDKPKGSEKPVE
jgi:hypothetical protein